MLDAPHLPSQFKMEGEQQSLNEIEARLLSPAAGGGLLLSSRNNEPKLRALGTAVKEVLNIEKREVLGDLYPVGSSAEWAAAAPGAPSASDMMLDRFLSDLELGEDGPPLKQAAKRLLLWAAAAAAAAKAKGEAGAAMKTEAEKEEELRKAAFEKPDTAAVTLLHYKGQPLGTQFTVPGTGSCFLELHYTHPEFSNGAYGCGLCGKLNKFNEKGNLCTARGHASGREHQMLLAAFECGVRVALALDDEGAEEARAYLQGLAELEAETLAGLPEQERLELGNFITNPGARGAWVARENKDKRPAPAKTPAGSQAAKRQRASPSMGETAGGSSA